MSRRAEGKARRRERILAAARALIDREGIDGWSMRKVARDAGVSVTTLYNLFGSKHEIRCALKGGMLDAIDRELESTPLERPLERARAVITVGVDQVVGQAAITRPGLLTADQGPADHDFVTPRAVEMQRVALQAAMDRGLLRDELRADLLAAQIYDGFHRAAVRWARSELDGAGFRHEALYVLYVCVLAVATPKVRRPLLAALRALEPKLARPPRRVA